MNDLVKLCLLVNFGYIVTGLSGSDIKFSCLHSIFGLFNSNISILSGNLFSFVSKSIEPSPTVTRMKIYLQRNLAKLIMLVIMFAGPQLSASNDITLNASGNSSTTVIENTFYKLQVSNTISGFKTLWLNTEQGEFVELLAPSYSKSNVVGAPELPVLSKLIEVPANATAEVTVISYNVMEYKFADFGITQRLLPVQPPQAKSDVKKTAFAYNKQLYETNGFYGESLARVEISGYLRSVRLANLIISPVEYNPVTNTIRVYNDLIVEVRFVGADKTKTDDIKARTKSLYFNSVFHNVLNYNPTDAMLDTMSNFPTKYVIVSDPMFHDALQPFVKWKTKRGFKIIEAYTNNPAVGNTFTSIKGYLQNLYTSATATDPAPSFVLFVGDVAQIPAYNCGAHYSDLYYCEYTGDFLPEVYYGRFSANNVAELLPQINKTLQYEQYLMPDPSYLNEVVMVAGADASHQLTWGNGQINYGTDYYFNAAHNLVSHTYLQPEPTGGNYAQNIHTNVSNGVSYANYTAHGSPDGWADPSFSIADVANLQNANKYCLMVGNCCQTNTYNNNTFGEALLRAENKGALGYIGASDYSYWDEDYWWGVGNGPIVSNPTYETTGLGAYDRTFHDHGEPYSDWYCTMDQMIFAGNLAVQESNSGMKQYYWEIYCLMGDPSTMVYFSVPPVLSVDYMPLLPMGTPNFEVQTEPYAYVAISKNNVLHGVAEADENGLALIPLLPFTEPGYADIVITKQNRQPYIDSIMVASPAGPYLMLDTYQIKDPGGNNNQIPEFSEPLSVDLTYQNFGNSNAINALSTLNTQDPYVTIPSNTHTWPVIASHGAATANNAFTIKVNDYIPDMHSAAFSISTQADTSVFTSGFSVVVYAPKLVNGLITISDVAGGNGNGRIDPGETISVTVPTTNTGHCTSSEVNTQMFVFGDYVTSSSPVVNLGLLVPGATGSSTFSFTVGQDAPLGSTFSIYITANAGAYNSMANLMPTVGQQIEDFETGNFLKYNWHMKGDKPWKINTISKYEGLYGAVSGSINNSQQSEMYIDGQVLTGDTISFYYRVSSENGYDFLKFKLDDVTVDSWSGITNWAKASYYIPAGNHRFSWVYEKDDSSIGGADAAWIDYIKFPAFSGTIAGPLVLNAKAVPDTICMGSQSQLYVFASGGTGSYNYNWQPSATLSNSAVFNPIAIPNEITTYQVTVSSALFSSTKNVTVFVENIPSQPVVTIENDHLVSSSPTANQWYNSQGPISGATGQTYYPTHTETYYVIAGSLAGCESPASNSVVFGFTDVSPNTGNDISVYPNPFNKGMSINYRLKTSGHVSIVLYNSIGKEVSMIDDSEKSSGNHTIVFDGSNLSDGVYYCKTTSCEGSRFVKVIKN